MNERTKKAESAAAPTGLIHRHERYDPTAMPDFLAIAAANIEDALVMVGARPGDYTVLDVMTLAVTLAAPSLAQTSKVTFVVPGTSG